MKHSNPIGGDTVARPSCRHSARLAAVLAIVALTCSCSKKDRLDIESPWFYLDEQQLDLHVSYSGWYKLEQQSFTRLGIGPKALQMVSEADSLIVASVFLFDNFYAEDEPYWDVVEALTSAIIEQKKQKPDLTVAIVLDPSNRAYSTRIAPAIARLTDAGADVFYSDLLTTRAHTPFKLVEAIHHGGRILSQATGGLLGTLVKKLLSAIRIPFVGSFDNYPANLQMAVNAALLKANHRKILITDGPDGLEALVSSANPHNASVRSTNYAVSLKGPMAKFIYDTQQRDIAQSIALGGPDYALWHRGATTAYQNSYLQRVPQAVADASALTPPDEASVKAKFLTETRVRKHLLDILDQIQAEDQVRIQMFYLSDIEVIDALMRAASIVRQPIKLLLDPSKDAFGRIKDGTPNRQVAALLTGRLNSAELRKLERSFPRHINNGQLTKLNIELRWFDTHGEQNHAKIFSVSNTSTDKYVLFNGSANWTGKNLDGINMEANIRIDGSARLTAKFNQQFDRFFHNTPTEHYSVAYDHAVYSQHSGLSKWLNGERFGFVSW